MSTIDPKWIQYDTTRMTTIENGDISELSISNQLDGVSVEKINESRIEIREVSNGAPTATSSPLDFYIEIPDSTV